VGWVWGGGGVLFVGWGGVGWCVGVLGGVVLLWGGGLVWWWAFAVFHSAIVLDSPHRYRHRILVPFIAPLRTDGLPRFAVFDPAPPGRLVIR